MRLRPASGPARVGRRDKAERPQAIDVPFALGHVHGGLRRGGQQLRQAIGEGLNAVEVEDARAPAIRSPLHEALAVQPVHSVDDAT